MALLESTVQGTLLGSYEAQIAPLPATQQLTMYQAMATLQYGAGVLGNVQRPRPEGRGR